MTPPSSSNYQSTLILNLYTSTTLLSTALSTTQIPSLKGCRAVPPPPKPLSALIADVRTDIAALHKSPLRPTVTLGHGMVPLSAVAAVRGFCAAYMELSKTQPGELEDEWWRESRTRFEQMMEALGHGAAVQHGMEELDSGQKEMAGCQSGEEDVAMTGMVDERGRGLGGSESEAGAGKQTGKGGRHKAGMKRKRKG